MTTLAIHPTTSQPGASARRVARRLAAAIRALGGDVRATFAAVAEAGQLGADPTLLLARGTGSRA